MPHAQAATENARGIRVLFLFGEALENLLCFFFGFLAILFLHFLIGSRLWRIDLMSWARWRANRLSSSDLSSSEVVIITAMPSVHLVFVAPCMQTRERNRVASRLLWYRIPEDECDGSLEESSFPSLPPGDRAKAVQRLDSLPSCQLANSSRRWRFQACSDG